MEAYVPYLISAVIVIALLLMWDKIIRIIGIVIVPENKVGHVTKKFVLFGDKKSLPDGKIIALEGEAGYQAQTLAPGLHWNYWPWQYSVEFKDLTIIPEGHIGLVLAKDGSEIPTGHILGRRVACDSFQDAPGFLRSGGQKGRQTAYITAGVYRINKYLFDVTSQVMIEIEDNTVGIVTTLDGEPLKQGEIAGRHIDAHNNFQDFDLFLQNGGQRGLQTDVMLAGSYNINPWAITIEKKPMLEIPIGHVGVVMSFVGEEGEDVSGKEFKHGNIVKKGQKGVWAESLGPGKYPINVYTMRVELVPTTNLVLNWATGRNEAHQLDKNLSTITVRSKDGFKFNIDVSQIIHVPMTESPKVIARFGSMSNLVSQVLEPTIGNYFRNSAQDSDVISFLSSRQQRQKEAKEHINRVLEQYNVQGVDTLIGDINPPQELMQTLTDRKIAEEQQKTFDTQQMAQIKRQELEKQTALANMQAQVVQAERGVEIADRNAQANVKTAEGQAKSLKLKAEAEAEQLKLMAAGQAEQVRQLAEAEARKIQQIGDSEAGKILAIGKSNAESYRLAVDAMGKDNFANLKVIEQIAAGHTKITPEVLVTGSDSTNGAITGLLGLKVLEEVVKKQNLSEQKSS